MLERMANGLGVFLFYMKRTRQSLFQSCFRRPVPGKQRSQEASDEALLGRKGNRGSFTRGLTQDQRGEPAQKPLSGCKALCCALWAPGAAPASIHVHGTLWPGGKAPLAHVLTVFVMLRN